MIHIFEDLAERLSNGFITIGLAILIFTPLFVALAFVILSLPNSTISFP